MKTFLLTKNNKYPLASALLVVVIVPLLLFVFAPSPIEAAVVSVKMPIMFHGSSIQIVGDVKVSCDCDVQGWVEGFPIEISTDGHFQKQFNPRPEAFDSGILVLKLVTTGRGLRRSSISSEVDLAYEREETKCRVVDPPKSWSKEYITFNVKCPETAGGSGRAFTITKSVPIEFNLPEFEIPVDIDEDGYASYSQSITIENARYDAKRAEREEQHWQDLQEKERYKKTPEGRRDAFLSILRERGIGSDIVSRAERGSADYVLAVYVTTEWQLMPYILRLKSAQFFEQQWSAALGKRGIVNIFDDFGREIGGTGITGTWAEKDE